MAKYIVLLRNMMVVMVAFALVGCNPIRPWPAGLVKEMPVDAPEEYKLGWKDGCESGFASYGNDYYKTFYKFHYDMELMRTNKLYMRIWKDSYKHCRSHVNRHLNDGWFWGEGWDGDNENSPFDGGSIRNRLSTLQGPGLPPIFSPLSTPGWGPQAWGAQVPEGDWLGREPAYVPNYDMWGRK